MRNSKLMLIPMLILLFALMSGTAMAATSPDNESETYTDTAWNTFSSAKVISDASYDGDFYWAGGDLNINGCDTQDDIIIAGRSMKISNGTVGGSIRAAGYDISISEVSVSNNITVAGYNLSFDGNARGVYMAGNSVSFSGECSGLIASGSVVTLSGTVKGDAEIAASKVIFSDGAVITGDLKISSVEEPSYPEGIKNHTFKALSNDQKDPLTKKTTGEIAKNILLGRLYMIAAMAIVALLLCLVSSNELDKSGAMLLARPVALPLTGFVTLCALPVVLILLCVTFIGLPAAGLLGLLIAAICFFATAFAGASAGRLVFPKMNKVLASVTGVAILTLLRAIPYLGGLLLFLSIIYTLGFIILVCYERIRALKKQPEAIDANEIAENSENN